MVLLFRNLIVGLKYTVKNESKECVDLDQIQNLLINSFSTCKSNLKIPNYALYIPRDDIPTRHFHVLDINYRVQNTELVFAGIIETSLRNSWTLAYPG